MKKTLLLTSLIAVASIAATTGTVKGFAETEANFKKEGKVTTKEFKAEKIGVETEVKVKDTGFSFEGTFQAKDLKLNETKKGNLLNNSKVWAKYELPEINGVNSYVKATISPKFVSKLEEGKIADKGNAELEADINYEVMKDVKVGINSKTNFPFNSKKLDKIVKNNNTTTYTFDVEDYSKLANSTHKLYVETTKDKDVYNGLKNVKAHLEVNHTYKETKKDAKDALKYVSGHAEAQYDVNKDVKLEGKIDFKRSFVNDEFEYKQMDETLYKKSGRYIHSYELKGTYVGIKNLTLSAKPFIAHINIHNEKIDKTNHAVYGVELNAKYMMMNDKLTLTGNSLLEGQTQISKFITKEDKEEKIVRNYGLFVFGTGAKYDYKVTDKFTVSPEGDATLKLSVSKNVTDAKKINTKVDLTLAPKVSAEYKPAESLIIKGKVELPIKFDNKGTKFGYKSTSIKGALNVEYKW